MGEPDTPSTYLVLIVFHLIDPFKEGRPFHLLDWVSQLLGWQLKAVDTLSAFCAPQFFACEVTAHDCFGEYFQGSA